MKRLLLKSTLYLILILVFLEFIVRIFHLYNEMPIEYVADDGIVKWIPGQEGETVYGNRRQHFSTYKINSSGYNSYREFKPTLAGFEVALLGDSYIEGLHQNYYNSIGKKIENRLPNTEVYEFGHSANDFADQMYLMHKNKAYFDLIDCVIIRIKYEKDLIRGDYKFYEKKPLFPMLRKSKLIVYMLNIGAFDAIKKLNRKLSGLLNRTRKTKEKEKSQAYLDDIYISNFKKLTNKYKFDKNKITLLIDSRVTSKRFINYLKETKINYIDYAITFSLHDSKPKTLIYDAHWNDYGRTLIAEDIVNFIKTAKKE